jgi:hypothetical protein
VRFAITWHSWPDGRAVAASTRSKKVRGPVEPQRALRILWLLKDADALDRVRLSRWEATDPKQLRNAESIALIDFAETLSLLSER